MAMQSQALFFLLLSFSLAAAEIARDGLNANIGGWTGLTFQASRYEPLCGSLASTRAPADSFTNCIPAIDSYTNDTQTTLAFYDISGVRLSGTGVGLGKDLCMCFSLSTLSDAEKLDICWHFDGNGVVSRDWQYQQVMGSWRTSGKALPHCADVNVPSLQGEWSQTAFMPTYTGVIQTLNLGPTTVHVTEVETQTIILTPTVATFSVSSITVITGSDGQVTTQPITYATEAAVIANVPNGGGGNSDSSKSVGLKLGLGLGIPALAAIVIFWIWIEDRKHKRAIRAQGNGGVPVNPNPTWAQR
ncbi:SubName: Full=Uncharacterized protein {ECO:0000313/EMBL:CCA73376.1} [Serendipita indica DSM 11827]|uniref:Uncharacterized protein n=1 Tax=Serendipita indica (strain DSM 11827) TaxID=1109443 RepID=G4TPX9_SERID|nr:SubName: Full=Uncharacterized protein {ECO:0000313/EMBL:CCA73376.1} [Serendipita indica DSM 11827]CCA73376.1 hypothetical protein PIIN_07330 [Serendipita indica DSM 11827]